MISLLQDARLAGGYENVPTDDIHMTQVEFNEHWLFILKEFIQPIQQKLYTGYFSDVSHRNGSDSLIDLFVVASQSRFEFCRSIYAGISIQTSSTS